MIKKQSQQNRDSFPKFLVRHSSYQSRSQQSQIQPQKVRSLGFIQQKGKNSKGLSLCSNIQITGNNSYIWGNLMKYPPDYCRSSILKLLRENVNLNKKVWNWLLRNHQKITPKLYNIRVNQFLGILEKRIISFRTEQICVMVNSKQINCNRCLSNIIGAYLVHRDDMSYGVTLYNISASSYFYSQSCQLLAFQIVAHICVSPIFLGFLTKDIKKKTESLNYIVKNINSCCPSMVFINNYEDIEFELFVQSWIQSFFFAICQNGCNLKHKILGYLMVENFSRSSVSKVCQGAIISCAKILNQGNFEKCVEVLNTPKLYLDEGLFLDYLLQ